MSGLLLEHLWQSTLFAAAAWLAACTLRNDAAVHRYRVWLLASLKFLVPFSVVRMLGDRFGFDAAALFITETARIMAPVVAPADLIDTTLASYTPSLGDALLSIWIAGSTLLSLRWLAAWLTVWRVRQAAVDLHLGLAVPVKESERVDEPGACGVLAPIILLPRGMAAQLKREQLDAILTHELHHVARKDNLKATLHAVVEILFWFHPAVWCIGKRLLEERERACDEAVLEAGHERHAYAEGILRVCRLARLDERAGVLRAAGGNLRTRIHSIVTHVARPPRTASTGAFAIAALLACAVWMAASTLSVHARSQGPIADTSLAVPSFLHVQLRPAADATSPSEVVLEGRTLIIRNRSLRELIALAYATEPSNVRGSGVWLDTHRYDVLAIADAELSAKTNSLLYRGLITEMLANDLNLEIYINRRCQSPCGRTAMRNVADDLFPFENPPTQDVSI